MIAIMADSETGLVVRLRGPSLEMRFEIQLHGGHHSYALCLHDGLRTTLDATIVVRSGRAVLRTRDGTPSGNTDVPLRDGLQLVVCGHHLEVHAAREPMPRSSSRMRAMSRKPIDGPRLDRLLGTLEDAVKNERPGDADAAFSALRSAVDRAEIHDPFFVDPAFSRMITRLGVLATTRREPRWVGWIFETLRRCSQLPDARAIDQMVFLPTEVLAGTEPELEALISTLGASPAELSPREARLHETLQLLSRQVRAHRTSGAA